MACCVGRFFRERCRRVVRLVACPRLSNLETLRHEFDDVGAVAFGANLLSVLFDDCVFADALGIDVHAERHAFWHVLVRNIPAHGESVIGGGRGCGIDDKVGAVVGADGAERCNPKLVFNGALENLLDVGRVDGVVVALVVGYAVVQDDEPCAALDLNFPRFGACEIPDKRGRVHCGKHFGDRSARTRPDFRLERKPVRFYVPFVSAMPSAVAVDEVACVDDAFDLVVVFAERRRKRHDAGGDALVGKRLFDVVCKLDDFFVQLFVVRDAAQVPVILGVVPDFVPGLG